MITLGNYNTLRIVKRVDFGLYLSPIAPVAPVSPVAATTVPPATVPPATVPDGSPSGSSPSASLSSGSSPSASLSSGSSPSASLSSASSPSASLSSASSPSSSPSPASPSPYDEILLPQRYVTPDMHIGDEIEVFLYLDHDERIVATTEHPLAKVGEFAYLECAWTNEYGAFLHWGLQKDLFCPFREQKQHMERGRTYYVYVMEDPKTHRLMATAKVERYQKTTGRQRALDFAEQLLRYLYENDGYCNLGDHSPADDISARFGVSKKAYKQAVGDLYRRHLITIGDDGIRLSKNSSETID